MGPVAAALHGPLLLSILLPLTCLLPPKCLWALLQLDSHAHISFSATATRLPFSCKHSMSQRKPMGFPNNSER